MTNFTINKLISWRLIDGQILILDSHINESAHELNEIGTFIFSQISTGTPTEQIRSQLKTKYPNITSIDEDFDYFIEKLQELGLIAPSN